MGDTATPIHHEATKEVGALTDGFHLVIDALKLNDITTIYNVPGIPITDLGRSMQAAGMRVLSFRHEQNAGYAAAIAGFLTKKPGICLTVSAPGFLNGLTALAHATTNCFPMILISGSSEREIVDLQQGDYEEMDQLAIAKPLCKAAYRVLRAEDIGIGIARAIRAAVSGRPGGVYLDLPAKLLAQVMDAEAGAQSLVKVIDAAPRQLPAPEAIARALEVLKKAQRPLIILGKGAAYAQADDDIRALVEKSGMPYLPMSMAKGLLPDTHPQSASAARSLVLKESDVVVLIVDDVAGCGLSTRVAAEAGEAFAVVHHTCAALTYSIAHEIGHIIGARHDKALDPNTLPFPYGHGYVNGNKWRDIMSYRQSCSGCPRIPYWSNPTIKIRGEVAGAVDADNARVILEQAERVAKFR